MEKEKTLKRKEILTRLISICEQLETWAKSSKPVSPIRINLMKAAIYGYSTILNAIKFQELDERLDKIEEQLNKNQNETKMIPSQRY